MKLADTIRKIRKSFSNYKPTIEILIYRENLVHNLNEYKRKFPKLSFAPVLKSNAYGHGLVLTAQILDQENIPFFVVDSLYEAMVLRSNGINSEILVIGYTDSRNIINNRLSRVTFAITSLDQLKGIGNLRKKKSFHLKIDTGMHRQGIQAEEIDEAIKVIRSNRSINLEGICSHFADADSLNRSYTEKQMVKWQKVVKCFKDSFSSIKYYHISATAGAYYSNEIDSNVARLGMGLYGVNPLPLAKLHLKPVLQMKSVISSLRNIEKGELVGYNLTYAAPQAMRLASVPVGYYEGVNRRLSNKGYFKVSNNFCRIIGRVSMNITSIDVTKIPRLKLNDEVIVISHHKEDPNSVENIARMAEMIPYEILVGIPPHLRRAVA